MNGRGPVEIAGLAGAGPSPEEAAAVIAALEQFMHDHAPVRMADVPRRAAWTSAALREGVNRAAWVGPNPPPFWI